MSQYHEVDQILQKKKKKKKKKKNKIKLKEHRKKISCRQNKMITKRKNELIK